MIEAFKSFFVGIAIVAVLGLAATAALFIGYYVIEFIMIQSNNNVEGSFIEQATAGIVIILFICLIGGLIHDLGKFARSKFKIKMCNECGQYPADTPSKKCSGCNAYRDHTGHF